MRTLLFTLVLCIMALSAYAQWQLLHTFSESVETVCFLDEQNGFIGTGTVPGGLTDVPEKIYYTADGGITWFQSLTPSGAYSVVDICGNDRIVGI